MNNEIDHVEEFRPSGRKYALPRIYVKKNVCNSCGMEMFYRAAKCPACEAVL